MGVKDNDKLHQHYPKDCTDVVSEQQRRKDGSYRSNGINAPHSRPARAPLVLNMASHPLSPDDRLFRISLCTLAAMWVVFLARSISVMLLLFAHFALDGKKSSAVRNTFSQILALGQLCTYFVFAVLTRLASALLWALPFLILIFGINLFYEYYASGLVGLIAGYNEYFVQTSAFKSIRVMQDYGRIAFEMTVPVFNYVVALLGLIPVETLRLSLSQKDAYWSLFEALGVLLTDVAQGIGTMLVRERKICKPGGSDFSDDCFDFAFRALDLGGGNGELARTTNALLAIVKELCPFAAGIANLALFPLTLPQFQKLLEDLLNAFWALAFTAWRIAQARCAVPGVASALCVPDMGSVFVFAERAVEKLGFVLDEWANYVFLTVLQVLLLLCVVDLKLYPCRK